jgi:hypothetical protein
MHLKSNDCGISSMRRSEHRKRLIRKSFVPNPSDPDERDTDNSTKHQNLLLSNMSTSSPRHRAPRSRSRALPSKHAPSYPLLRVSFHGVEIRMSRTSVTSASSSMSSCSSSRASRRFCRSFRSCSSPTIRARRAIKTATPAITVPERSWFWRVVRSLGGVEVVVAVSAATDDGEGSTSCLIKWRFGMVVKCLCRWYVGFC